MAEYAGYCLRENTILDERYRILRVIGRGGFGITYEAVNERVHLRVAVKEFFCREYMFRESAESDRIRLTEESFREQFERSKKKFLEEGRSIGDFQDEAGIVKIRESFEANGTAYIVMDYLEGSTLKDHIKDHKDWVGDHKNPDTEALIRTFLPLMNTLARIHSCGIIHRDISPDNLIYMPGGTLKLIDFGAARDYFSDSRTYSVVLKNGYAPCEQYDESGRLGPYTDIYALTAVLYECITGVVPETSIMRMFHDELKFPSELGIRIPSEVEKVLKKGLALDPAGRYQKMEDMIAELEKWLPKPPDENRSRKKKRIMAVTCLAAAACLAGGVFRYCRAHMEMIKFYGQTTETVIIQPKEDISEEEYSKMVSTIRGRLDRLAGEKNYILREKDRLLTLITPLSVYNEDEGILDMLRKYVTRPMKLSLAVTGEYYSDLLALSELDKNEIESSALIPQEEVPEKLRLQMEDDFGDPDHPAIRLTLTDEKAGELSREMTREEDGYTILIIDYQMGSDAYWYDMYVDDDWKDLYFAGNRNADAALYCLTHEGHEEAPYIYYEIPAVWEEESIIPGENQKPADEVGMPAVIREYRPSSIETVLSKGEWMHTVADVKSRLDALDVPYAFGISALDSSHVVIRMRQGDMNDTISEMLLSNSLKAMDPWERGIYLSESNDISLSARKEGGYVCQVTLTEYQMKSFTELKEDPEKDFNEEEIYLSCGDRKIACGRLDEASGSLLFDRSMLGDSEVIGEEEVGIYELLRVIRDTGLPVIYNIGDIQYQDEGHRVSLDGSENESIFQRPFISGEIQEQLKESFPGLQVRDMSDSGYICFDLNRSEEDSSGFAEKSLKEMQEILEQTGVMELPYKTVYLSPSDGQRGRRFVLSRSYTEDRWKLYNDAEDFPEEIRKELKAQVRASGYFGPYIDEEDDLYFLYGSWED